ncbi:Crp/Fnr family transcriptional regulator [Fodinibius halophilus]|uniref:Crp/Fnr family transcriptional regulator n=1 Tax=Fodinibius halophilus TaxID=1736908 RepID=A0A6M1TGK1_9BACT|nr:Crp/Fnr family transcriptional regulator [Fodinibius halophilus]NGP87780.1 Crp/Fnr family transcriptional regulator [Fodinibius halophilus]
MYDLIFDNISKYIHLTKDDKAELKSHLRTHKVGKGQYLHQQGRVVKYDSFVCQGALKSSYIDKEGKEYILHFAIEDWWITDFESFTNQTPAKLDIVALEDSVLLQVDYNFLQALFEKDSKYEHFYRCMNERHMVTLFNVLLSLLSKDAEERYLEFISQYPQFWDRLPQYEIASYLNVSPEHLSRIRKKVSQKSG